MINHAGSPASNDASDRSGAEPGAARPLPAPPPALDVPPLSVLLLEDNAFDAELAIETLRRSRPCSVRHVTNRRQFREALQGGCYDLVLSDFSLPDFSGLEALAAVQEQCPDVPFVFISGVLGEEHAVDMLKHGATDYVVKSRLNRLPLAVDRAIAVARERQQRQHAESLLRESEQTYARVVESLQDYAIVLLSPDGELRSWNPAAERILGHPLDLLRGRSARMFQQPGDRAAKVFERQLARARAHGSARDERWLLRADGRTFFANCVLTAVNDAEGHLLGFSLIVRDETEARSAAEALQAAKTSAERANQAKDRFIAVLSHELRTPLVPIMTGAQLLQMKLELPPPLAEVVAMIRRNVALEARLIDDLLDVTSIERGKLTLDLKPVDAHAALRAALETSELDIGRKSLQLQLDLAAADARVEADEARLQQIFWNLVRNAVKFTPDGGSIRVHSSNPRAGVLEVRVVDSGVGIPADALPRIFTPFEQAGQARTGYGGLGLGLAIASGLAQKHGGELLAHSDGPGRGAAFTLVLRTLGDAPGSEPVPDPGRVQHLHAGLRVLLVEDNLDAEAALRHALEAHGHDVRTARTVAQAREAIAALGLDGWDFDVLVSDIGLPDGSGIDVVQTLRGRRPAIALSGYGMEENRRASLEAGFARHLIKPIDAARLHEAVLEAARSARAEERD